MGELGAGEMIILKWIFKKLGRGINWIDLAQRRWWIILKWIFKK